MREGDEGEGDGGDRWGTDGKTIGHRGRRKPMEDPMGRDRWQNHRAQGGGGADRGKPIGGTDGKTIGHRGEEPIGGTR